MGVVRDGWAYCSCNIDVSLPIGRAVLWQTANDHSLACVAMRSAGLGGWDICIHIRDSRSIPLGVLFSFVLIVGHFLSPAHPPSGVLLLLIALLVAQML